MIISEPVKSNQQNFIEQNRKLCIKAFDTPGLHFSTVDELVGLAREFFGYGPKTSDKQIWDKVKGQWKVYK